MENSAGYLDALIRETRKPESEVMTKVFQIGLRQLWRDHILGRYLRHEISRDEAVKPVGVDRVNLVPSLYGEDCNGSKISPTCT